MWRSLHAWISLEWGFLWHSRRKGIMEDASVFPNLSHSGVFWRCFVVGDVNVSLSSKGLRVNCWKSYQSVTKSWDKITRYGKRMLEWWMLWIGIKPFSKLRRQWWDSPDIYNCFSNLPWMSNLLKKKHVSQQAKQSCSLPRTRNRQEKPWTLP